MTQENEADKDRLSSASLINTSTIIYGAMASIGALISFYNHQSLVKILAWPETPDLMIRFVTLAGLGTGVLLVLSYFFDDWFPSFKALKQAFTHLLGRNSWSVQLYLAFVSAVGEELLFRGAIQPYAGLAWTSILFGLLHLGPGGRISSWSIWAALAGLLLGWMFLATGSLWPPLLCHFAVNAISLVGLSRGYKKAMAEAGRSAKAPAPKAPTPPSED